MKRRILSLALAVIMALGIVTPAVAAGPTFSDVPESHWAYADVETAAAQGLMNGIGNGMFGPDMKVSVSQFLTLVGRVVFPDTKVTVNDTWYGPYVTAAQTNGLLEGTQVDVNDAGAEITRYDMAVILRAAAKKLGVTEVLARQTQITDYTTIPRQYAEAVRAVYGMGLIQGDGNGNFNGNNAMVRSEVVTVVVRLAKIKPVEPTPEPEKPAEPEKPTTSAGSGSGSSSSSGSNARKPDPEGARKALIEGLTNMEKKINTAAYHMQAEDLADLVDEILDAEPYRYFVFSYVAGYINSKRETEYMFFLYFGNGTKEFYEEFKKQMKEAEEKAEEIVASTVHDGMSDYEIAKALHDYLVFNMEYDHNWREGIFDPSAVIMPGEYGIYYALIEQSGVCSTYSDAYKYLMNLAGIPCEYVSGNSQGTDEIAAALGYGWSVSHAWNIVQIDGEWYHADVTWDDLGGDGIRYDYFLKSDQAMSGHYGWESPYPCTSTKYDNVTHVDERVEAEKAAIIADFMERFNTLPYRSAEGLTGTDELSDEELLSYHEDKVYYPMDEYTYEEMERIYFIMVNISDNPEFLLNGQFHSGAYEDGQWYLVVWRSDIWREYERRHEVTNTNQ